MTSILPGIGALKESRQARKIEPSEVSWRATNHTVRRWADGVAYAMDTGKTRVEDPRATILTSGRRKERQETFHLEKSMK